MTTGANTNTSNFVGCAPQIASHVTPNREKFIHSGRDKSHSSPAGCCAARANNILYIIFPAAQPTRRWNIVPSNALCVTLIFWAATTAHIIKCLYLFKPLPFIIAEWDIKLFQHLVPFFWIFCFFFVGGWNTRKGLEMSFPVACNQIWCPCVYTTKLIELKN